MDNSHLFTSLYSKEIWQPIDSMYPVFLVFSKNGNPFTTDTNQLEYSIITLYSRMINGVSHFSLDAI